MKRTLAVLLALSCAVGARAALAPPAAAKAARRAFLRATLLQHRGDLAGAARAYDAALSADPDSPYLLRQAAEAALELGDSDRALALARRLEAADPASPQTRLLLGRVLWAREDAPGAQAAFETAVAIASGSAESVLALGDLLAERAPERARPLLLRLLKDHPEQAAEARHQLAGIEYEAGQIDAAIAHLRAGLAAEPSSLPLRYGLAQAYEAKFSTGAAIEEYQRILSVEPSNVALIDHVAQLYSDQGDPAEARTRFEEARRLQPSDPFSSQWLAADAERQDDWAAAAAYLKDSAALAEDASLCLRLSYYHTQAGDLAAAVDVLEAAHRRWPADDQVAYYLALGYDDIKRGAQAVELLRRVLEIKPDLREARFQLAAILEKAGRIEEAEAQFRRLLADKPDDAAALNYLGYALADRGRKLPEAEELIQRAVMLQPANAAYLDSLGWVHFKLGRLDQAVGELEAAARRGAQDAAVWDHLADAYAASGRPQEAWLGYRRAQALDEQPAAIRRKAEKLQRGFDSGALGGLYMKHLAALSGRLAKLSAVCKVSGRIGARDFSYDGLLTFKAPGELDLDLLGPLMMPIFRVRMAAEGFSMDDVRAPGLDPGLARRAVERLFALLRENLSGELFALRPARYRKRWGRRAVAAGERRLDLDRDGVRLAAVTSPEGKIILGDYFEVQGRLLPGRAEVSGRGWSLRLVLEQMKPVFTGDGSP
ncbi:MAG: tetratricopeptide repeat protein [Elusimicrobia bacterium]|nr:tetratricopeptide repeat protein [Elusimicrobiota bacterium]